MIIQNTPIHKTQTYPDLNFQAGNKVVVNHIKKTPINLNQVGIGVAGIIGGILAHKKNEESSFDKCLALNKSEDFEKYRKQLIAFLKENNYPESFINDIQTTQNEYSLHGDLEVFISRTLWNEDLLEDENLDIMGKIARREFSPELDKLLIDNEKQRADLAIPLIRLSTETDTNPDVIKIKNELKEKYGQEKLFFNNDLEFAIACKEVFEILDKNNLKYNDTIIAYNDLDAVGVNLETSNGKCVIVNKENWQMGDSDLKHILLHEILHSYQPRTLEFNLQQIPEEYDLIISGVSDYASGNLALEIHCELYTKKLLKGLSKEEEEVFNYLGGTFA